MSTRDSEAVRYIIPETPEQAARFEGFRDGFDRAGELFVEFLIHNGAPESIINSARREFYECRSHSKRDK